MPLSRLVSVARSVCKEKPLGKEAFSLGLLQMTARFIVVVTASSLRIRFKKRIKVRVSMPVDKARRFQVG